MCIRDRSYHEGKTIELSEEEFRELMGDEWGWQRDWRNMMTSVDDHAQHYLGAAPAVTD